MDRGKQTSKAIYFFHNLPNFQQNPVFLPNLITEIYWYPKTCILWTISYFFFIKCLSAVVKGQYSGFRSIFSFFVLRFQKIFINSQRNVNLHLDNLYFYFLLWSKFHFIIVNGGLCPMKIHKNYRSSQAGWISLQIVKSRDNLSKLHRLIQNSNISITKNNYKN